MDYAGGEACVDLRGPSGVSLNLSGFASKQIAWEPVKRGQMELEVRARIVGTSAIIGSIPIVRWDMELGHGKNVYREPNPALPQIAGTPMLKYSLPARGMIFRINARELRLFFELQGPLAGVPIPELAIRVSIMPCLGAWCPCPIHQAIAFPFAGVQQPFPAEAREWKLTNEAGLPIVGQPALSVLFVGVAGALFAPTAANQFQDWSPIPHDAAGWVASSLLYAAYR